MYAGGCLAAGNVINGQQIAGQGHHQPSRSLQQHGIIAFAERFRRPLYLAEINRTAVYLGCQVRRTGIAEYFGHGQFLPVFGKPARPHQAAMQLDIFRNVLIARLYELLRNGADARLVPFPR